jgi:hypothetical protein
VAKNQQPVKVYSDSLDGEFYYDPKGHALHPVTPSHQRNPFEETFVIDSQTHQVIPAPHVYTKEENRLMWEKLHPNTPPPSRPSTLPGELEDYNSRAHRDAKNPFPPNRGSQHGRPPSKKPAGGGSGKVQIVPAAVRQSAKGLREEGVAVGSAGDSIAHVNVSDTASVFPLGLASFSSAATTHLHQRQKGVENTADSVVHLANELETFDSATATQFRV